WTCLPWQPCPAPWPRRRKTAGRRWRSSLRLSWLLLPAGALLQIGNPDLLALVVRRAQRVGPVVVDGARVVLQIEVAKNAQVLVSHGEVRVLRQRLLVDRPRLGEAPGLAIQQRKLVAGHGVVRLDRQRLLELRLGEIRL